VNAARISRNARQDLESDRRQSQEAGLAAAIGLAQRTDQDGVIPSVRSRPPVDIFGEGAQATRGQVAGEALAQTPPVVPVSAGRHAGAGRSPSRAGSPSRRGSRFFVFSAIGGSIFLMGFGLQAALTGIWHIPPWASYLIQAVISVETSFLLNRWLTWRDRNVPFWTALWRFNVQKTVTVVLNQVLYAGLLRLNMNYLLANILLAAVFTVVNYVAGDRFVFTSKQGARSSHEAVRSGINMRRPPRISVVVPCRDNQRTIRTTVLSLLDQDYPLLNEILLVGSPGDSTWSALTDILDPRLTTLEVETPPGLRDANYKRDTGIRMISGDLVALVDSDIELPPNWMSSAVADLEGSGAECVTGGMKSVHDSFWGRFTDDTIIGAKTPRIGASYMVTSATFGKAGHKPPITANALFTRRLYEACPIDPTWSHGSYEDYEWFWRVTSAGFGVLVSKDLYGCHHHRRGWKALAREYRRSSRGCAYFIRKHRESPFAQRRLRQAIALPVVAVASMLGASAAAMHGYGEGLAVLVLGAATAMCTYQFARSHRLESIAYPAVGLGLGLVFTTGLVTNLVRPSATPAFLAQPPDIHESKKPSGLRRLLHPLTAILLGQAALSLSLMWANTAFNDEAEYLWGGHLQISHWLHGTPLPTTLTSVFSGSPIIYPPLGALADDVGGLTAARMLALIFMLVTTVLLYQVTGHLFGNNVAAFAAALWAISEPAIRLGAYATYDAPSIFLTTLAVWLTVRAGYKRWRGEYVAAAALVLALANATAYSGVVIDPVVIVFAFLVWMQTMRWSQALSCAAWLAAGWAAFFVLAMTVSRSWAGILFTIVLRGTHNGFGGSAGTSSVAFILKNVWGYSGIILILAAIGTIVALSTEKGSRRVLLLVMAGASLVVPLAQIHDQTETSLDKHLAYGIWFAAMAAAYGCNRLLKSFPSRKVAPLALACSLALAYPAADNWQAAWYKQHSWGNANSFVTAYRPVAANVSGTLFASNQTYVAKYYTSQGHDWMRWASSVPPSPAGLSSSERDAYYLRFLQRANFGAIALFYTTTLHGLPTRMVVPSSRALAREALLNVVASNTGSAGDPMAWLPAFTIALENDPAYRLVSIGPYDTSTTANIYAIWQKQ
jgi:putative flippase GtrA/glycosyltransferase involved in cell wall biosynthesis/4-amino-4-deoxy-L-arabinose transferase-like glycosyltransferase